MEAAAARAGVVVAVGRFHADVGDKAGQQGAVDLFVAGFFSGTDLGAVLFLIQLFLFELAAKSWSLGFQTALIALG